MLVKNIMKVLSNIFGLNKKISVNDVAIKNSKNEGITLDEYLNEINDRDIYSTDEKVIGTWIDGKPLYQKIMKFITAIGENYTTDIAHGVSDVDLIFVKNAFLVNNSSSDSYYGWSFPLPIGLFKSNTTEDKLGIVASRYGVRFYVETSWGTAWTKYVVLNYTKTTD